MKTPTLILSDTGDFRVPYTQAFKLFRTLKESGVETSFVAIPAEGHFPSDPVRGREVLRRWIGWLEPRLKEAAPLLRTAPPSSKVAP